MSGEAFGLIPSQEPDLLVYMECNDGDRQYLELAELECTKFYWDFDTALHEDMTKCIFRALRADHIAFGNYRYAKKYKAKYLPYGVDPVMFIDSDAKSGIAMIGTPFDDRVAFCDAAGIELISGVYGDEYASKLRSLMASVHVVDSGGDGLLVARIFETMASGTALFTRQTEYMNRHFRPMVDYVPITGPDSVKELWKFYSKNPDELRRIALNGLSAIRGKHLYINRARAILTAVECLPRDTL
jgi:spore maturation protein CgeB